MSETRTRTDEPRRTTDDRPTEIQTIVRRFAALNVLAGLLGLVGPAVWGNDDDGLINTEPGLFLGVVAVNGPHALLHVLFGGLGLLASRDAELAHKHMKLNAAFFGTFAAVGLRRFGFERGVHMIAGLAVDGWGNLGHAVVSAFSLRTVLRYGPDA